MSNKVYVETPATLTLPGASGSARVSMGRIAEVARLALSCGHQAAAREFELSDSTVDAYLRWYYNSLVDALDFADLKEKFAKYSRRWDTQPELEGDWLILYDAHVPFIHWKTLEKACAAAKYMNIKKVLLAGDWFDFEDLSRFDFGGDQVTAVQELKMGREVIERMLTQFDEAVAFRGNHEERLIKFLKKIKRVYRESEDLGRYSALMEDELGSGWRRYKELLECDRLLVSNDSRASINGDIMVVHGSSQSAIAPNSEEQLCYSFGMKHTINGHIHNFGIRTCKDGKTLAVRSGIICDPLRVFYKQKRTTAHYGWVNGFAWVKDNKIGLYVDNPNYVNPIEPIIPE